MLTNDTVVAFLLDCLSRVHQRPPTSLVSLLVTEMKQQTSQVADAIVRHASSPVRMKSVYDQILSLTSNCRELADSFDTRSDALQSTLLKRLHKLRDELRSQSESLELLAPFARSVEGLKAIDHLVEESVAASKQCKYALAVRKLKQATNEATKLRGSSDIDSSLKEEVNEVLKAVHVDISHLWESLAVTCKQLWNKRVHFKSSVNSESGRLSFVFAIDFNCEENEIEDFVTALDEMELLQALVADVGTCLRENVLEPYVKRKVDILDINDKQVTVRYTSTSDRSISSLSFIQKLELIFCYITVSFSKMKSGLFCRYFSLKAGEILNWIIDKIVMPAMPTNQSQLPDYRILLETVTAFESTLIVNGYLDKKSMRLETLLTNLNTHFASKVFQHVLVKGRTLVKKSLYPMTEFGCRVHEGNHCIQCKHELDERFPCFVERKVSVSMLELKELIRETFAEFASMSEEFNACLCNTTRNLCELFMTVSQRVHRKEISSTPVALFYNNCMFFAYEMMSLGYDYEDQLKPSSVHTFVDLVPVLREFGSEYFLAFLRKQRNLSFTDLYDASNKLIANLDQQ